MISHRKLTDHFVYHEYINNEFSILVLCQIFVDRYYTDLKVAKFFDQRENCRYEFSSLQLNDIFDDI